MLHRRTAPLVCGALVAWLIWPPALGQDPNACDLPGEAPDLILSDLFLVDTFGHVEDITAFAIGAESCNVGSCQVNWFASTPDHPAFGQNMYRLAGGKFEQIGQSWMAHRFFALSQLGCTGSCAPTGGTYLGVGCTTQDIAPYAAGQLQLGPRFEVNPVTGDFEFPATDQQQQGDAVYKRLQVHDADLDPALNPGALYFVEGINVARDDALAGHQDNNASHRRIEISRVGDLYHATVADPTRAQKPAVEAWSMADPAVSLNIADVPGDGRFLVASRATPLGNGLWHYEYAVENLNSHRAGSGFHVPLPPEPWATHLGFHDVDYHSGEPFDGTDWSPALDPGAASGGATWTTRSFDDDPDANALRWGTLYNFRFDAAVAPVQGKVTLDLFRPGTPVQVAVSAITPATCDADGSCDATETACACPSDCGAPVPVESDCSDGVSNDCDGLVDCLDPDCGTDPACPEIDGDADGRPLDVDCDDTDPEVWAIPGEAVALLFSTDPSTFGWLPPAVPGASTWTYEALRSEDPGDFLAGATCLPAEAGATTLIDGTTPEPGGVFFYLVRASNRCPFGTGSAGTDSGGGERASLGCS